MYNLEKFVFIDFSRTFTFLSLLVYLIITVSEGKPFVLQVTTEFIVAFIQPSSCKCKVFCAMSFLVIFSPPHPLPFLKIEDKRRRDGLVSIRVGVLEVTNTLRTLLGPKISNKPLRFSWNSPSIIVAVNCHLSG